MYASLTLNYL